MDILSSRKMRNRGQRRKGRMRMSLAGGDASGKGRRALVLFSGGLDSMLAAELLRRCGVEITALTFVTPFFGSSNAERAAGALGLDLVVADITERHLDVLKKPRYGYGKNMNPCIDCHALMVRVALERLEELGADFVATGEVLGERPKSQNRQALELVARHSGAGDLLLRRMAGRRIGHRYVPYELFPGDTVAPWGGLP